jgi:hypothetical protein
MIRGVKSDSGRIAGTRIEQIPTEERRTSSPLLGQIER